MIFFDFEVFKHDWLVVFFNMETREEIVIVNNPANLAGFYALNAREIFVGYNCRNYDQYIFKGILCELDPKAINDFIIVEGRKGFEYPGFRHSNRINEVPLVIYDVFQNIDRGLKYFEGSMGNNIRETSVPFDIDRKLTDEEIQETIKYCRHDVEQTIRVFLEREKATGNFNAQMGLLKLFDLPLADLGRTKPQLSAKILGAHRRKYSDEFDIDIPPTLEIKRYQQIVDWYVDKSNHKYRVDPENEKSNKHCLKIDVAGIPHVFGWGGLHGSRDKYHEQGYFINMDVASLYPSLMIEYDLMSRSAQSEKFKEIYDLRLKLKAEKDPKQASLKLVLNSTYGAMKDKFNPLYDPRQANRVCVYGQLLLLDLVEHLEDIGAEIIQVNTDGVLVRKPKDGSMPEFFFDRVDDVAFEWEQRTGLKLEFDEYKEVFQKDVNNYVFVGVDGSIKTKGGYVKKQGALSQDLPVINRALVEYMVNKVPVKRTIEAATKLIDFQMVARLSSKYVTFVHNNKSIEGKTCRVFASKDRTDGGLEKVHATTGTMTKVASTPEHCFIVNENVTEMTVDDFPSLNRAWYVDLAKKRLADFGL